MFCRFFLLIPALMCLGLINSVQAQAVTNFVTISPCRAVDTREIIRGALGSPALQSGIRRDFPILQSDCKVPSNVLAYSLNITVIPRGSLMFLTVWPTGQDQPNASTLNSINGSVLANAAIVAGGTNGALSLYAAGETDVIIDINGYFVASSLTADQLSQAVGQINQQIAQVNQQIAQQGSQLTQQISLATQQGSQTNQQGAQLGQLSQQITQQGASLTQHAAQLSQLNQQVSPLAQQLSQINQQATQVTQQASQVSQLVSQVTQQSSLISATNGTMRIGTPGVQTKTYIAGIEGSGVDVGDMVLVDQNGQLGTIQSSLRYKENVKDVGTGSERIYKLRPVQFQYKRLAANGQKPLQYGLIAEEVAQVYPELVVYNIAGEVETVQYQKLPALLLNEVQKQHRLLGEQQAKIDSQSVALQKAMDEIQSNKEEIRCLTEKLSTLLPQSPLHY